MNYFIFIIGSISVILGIIILLLTYLTSKKTQTLFEFNLETIPYLHLNYPFRLQKDSDITVNIETNGSFVSWYVTDFFPGSDSETSGPRHLSEKSKIKTTHLLAGEYVLAMEINPKGNYQIFVTSSSEEKRFKYLELWGTQLITIGLAFLALAFVQV